MTDEGAQPAHETSQHEPLTQESLPHSQGIEPNALPTHPSPDLPPAPQALSAQKRNLIQKATRITKIEMKGFKSFANKVEMDFKEHFNCILGPNGSGKSNVLDALCFVLGKSSVKGLRAEKASHLIYNGGKLKNPAKEAEVSLYLDNSKNTFPYPEKEIKITRIIRDKGERKEKAERKEAEGTAGQAAESAGQNASAMSNAEVGTSDASILLNPAAKGQDPATQGIYKINGKTRTRSQILELLSKANINPDGYNIILQGDIMMLIEMPSIERRQIIEEISGINIYEDKKERAIKELQKVEEKMAEADIILAERKTYLHELKKERDQALKFKDLDMKIRQNKATLIHKKLSKKKEEAEQYAGRIGKVEEQVAEIRERIRKLRIQAEERRAEIESINREVEQRGEQDQVRIHKEIEKLKVEQAVRDARLQTLKQELGKLATRHQELEKSKQDIEDRITKSRHQQEQIRDMTKEKEAAIKKLEESIHTFRERHSMDNIHGLDTELMTTDKEADELQQDLTKKREEQQNLLREKEKLELMLQSIDEKILKVAAAESENKDQVKRLKDKQDLFKKFTLDLGKALGEDSSLAAQLQGAKQKLNAAREDLSRMEARNITVRETVAGGIAIQRILELKKEGVYGLVSSLGNVSAEYSMALEVAAGARIKGVVVETDKIAEECIRHLKEGKLGVATFLPLNKLREPFSKLDKAEKDILLKKEGVRGFATDLVTYDPKFTKVFSYVFENTLVVESIAAGRAIGIGKIRMVTLQGDLIEVSGAMQGGFRQKSSGLGFAEKEVTDAIARLQAEVSDYERMVSTLEQKRQDQDELIVRLRQKKAELEGDMITLEKSLHLDSSDLDLSRAQKKEIGKQVADAQKRLDVLQEEFSEKNKALADMKMKKQQLRDKVSELRNPAVLAELNVFEDKRKELEKNIVELRSEEKNLEGQIGSIFSPEIENIDRIFKQQQREKEQFEKEAKELDHIKEERQKELDEKEQAESAFYEQFKTLFTKRNSLSDAISKIEQEALGHEEKARGHEQAMNLQSLEAARVKAELAGLEEEFRQYEDVELFDDKSEEAVQKEIWQFEKIQADIGAVNMKALNIYDRVEREFKSVTDKKDKLNHERDDILILINEIDSRKKDLFMRTFAVVDRNFQKIFQALSTKGEAFLELEDEEDPFAAGLTIKVRLSGSKFLDIRSLSGGEKTMTALAFLFAVQEHEPASFYVLDEVDAALDKRNSEKLALLVKSYAKHAQYLMISHNDAVISEADTLYGISMNEHGISKVTTLKM